MSLYVILFPFVSFSFLLCHNQQKAATNLFPRLQRFQSYVCNFLGGVASDTFAIFRGGEGVTGKTRLGC
jgi:hypothetical protein